VSEAGDAGQLPSAFADAVVAAVREHDAPAVDVAVAVGLGWYLAALAHPGRAVDSAAAARGDLAGLAAVTDGQVLDFCHSQVEVAFARLRALVEKTGLALPDLKELRDCLESDARSAAAGHVDNRTLAVLGAVDFRLGKAYGVGRALLNLSTRPAPDATLAQHLTGPRIAPVVAAIDDLSSALEPHAGHGVRASIVEWQASVDTGSPVAPTGSDTWPVLARQGELWRALLSGEKSGLDMLEIEDYLDAADRLSTRMRTMGRRLVRQFPELVIAVVALFVLGVVLVLVTDSAAAIVAGAGTILASLGLTWRGAGRSLGGLSAKLEQPLWGAELDTAVTQAITLLARENERDVTAERRRVAVALGRPTE
jgi:hypothetical protein